MPGTDMAELGVTAVDAPGQTVAITITGCLTDMVPQQEQSTALLWRTFLAESAGRTSRTICVKQEKLLMLMPTSKGEMKVLLNLLHILT